jgi:hypothetical protein
MVTSFSRPAFSVQTLEIRGSEWLKKVSSSNFRAISAMAQQQTH